MPQCGFQGGRTARNPALAAASCHRYKVGLQSGASPSCFGTECAGYRCQQPVRVEQQCFCPADASSLLALWQPRAHSRFRNFGPQQIPTKGSLDTTVPVDPLIYRFNEITQVYGTTIKAIIHEMFGDGIMSAIDFEMDIQKKADPKGDRVVVTYSGKFLPYRKW